jgi:hypothetical protein
LRQNFEWVSELRESNIWLNGSQPRAKAAVFAEFVEEEVSWYWLVDKFKACHNISFCQPSRRQNGSRAGSREETYSRLLKYGWSPEGYGPQDIFFSADEITFAGLCPTNTPPSSRLASPSRLSKVPGTLT